MPCSKLKKAACQGPSCRWVVGKGCKSATANKPRSPLPSPSHAQFRNFDEIVARVRAVTELDKLTQLMRVVKSQIDAVRKSMAGSVTVDKLQAMMRKKAPMASIVKLLKSVPVKDFIRQDLIDDALDIESGFFFKYSRKDQVRYLTAAGMGELKVLSMDWLWQSWSIQDEDEYALIRDAGNKKAFKAYVKRRQQDEYWTMSGLFKVRLDMETD